MSLLMKALQQAAQNRGTAGAADSAPSGVEGARAGPAGAGLSLEPMAGADPGGSPRPDPWASARTAGSTFEVGRPESSARNFPMGGRAEDPSPLASLTRIQWILLLGGLAGSVLGGYVYIEVNHPGLWHRGFAALSPAGPAPGPAVRAGNGPAPDTPGPGATAPSPVAPADPAVVAALPPAAATGRPTDPAQAPAAARAPTPSTPSAPSPSISSTPSPPSAVSSVSSVSGATSTAPLAEPVPAPTAARRLPAVADDSRRIARPAETPGASAPAAESGATEPIRVTRASAAPAIDPALAQGYEHLQAGRLEAAAGAYGAVLARQPGHTDAQLGLAAVALARGDAEAARQLYQRVLRAEPRNPWAQAGWLSLLAQSDPAAAEAQLRELIAREPSALLWSRLGALLAAQGRWPQAQQAYFQAHSLQPDQPDHAYNLAVSLERIAQPRIALGFLRTAVRLAEAGAPARFDLAAARGRIERLTESAGRP